MTYPTLFHERDRNGERVKRSFIEEMYRYINWERGVIRNRWQRKRTETEVSASSAAGQAGREKI